jgi:hypothetical protein
MCTKRTICMYCYWTQCLMRVREVIGKCCHWTQCLVWVKEVIFTYCNNVLYIIFMASHVSIAFQGGGEGGVV